MTDEPTGFIATVKPKRLDARMKRAAFVYGGLWTAFHLFGVVELVVTSDWPTLRFLLVLDAVGVLLLILAVVARRLFPDKER